MTSITTSLAPQKNTMVEPVVNTGLGTLDFYLPKRDSNPSEYERILRIDLLSDSAGNDYL